MGGMTMGNRPLKEDDLNKILAIAMEVGNAILQCGGEVRRVEDAISRICFAYGCTDADVFSLTSEIVATASYGTTRHTQSKRIHYYSYNLKQLEEINALSREICRLTPEPEVVHDRITDIIKQSRINPLKKYVGFALAATAFTVFFGGQWVDGLASLIVASVIFLIEHYIKKERINQLAYTITASFIAGMVAIGINAVVGSLDLNAVIIGNVMLMIPGVSFTNGVRDLLGGDIAAGFLRISEAVLISVAIAAGFALPLLMIGGA
jgi:uncharacterized membrane protein YjjP (DUF1212 family)